MTLLLKKIANTVLIIITVPLILFLPCLLLISPLAPFTVSLIAFCFWRFIGKPLQSWATSGVEHAQPRCFLLPAQIYGWPRPKPYVSTLASTLTPLTHKPLASYSLPSAWVSSSPFHLLIYITLALALSAIILDYHWTKLHVAPGTTPHPTFSSHSTVHLPHPPIQPISITFALAPHEPVWTPKRIFSCGTTQQIPWTRLNY